MKYYAIQWNIGKHYEICIMIHSEIFWNAMKFYEILKCCEILLNTVKMLKHFEKIKKFRFTKKIQIFKKFWNIEKFEISANSEAKEILFFMIFMKFMMKSHDIYEMLWWNSMTFLRFQWTWYWKLSKYLDDADEDNISQNITRYCEILFYSFEN